MVSILIWGFYNQGNLGDDLMGMMLYEMLEELGARPVVFTKNERFAAMGYRSVGNLAEASPDLLLLGGGAFFKNTAGSKPAIEKNLENLAEFVRSEAIPVHGISLGSDGVSSLDHLSPARQAIVRSENFRSVSLRLRSDDQLGLENARHISDIVLLAALCSNRYERLTPIDPPKAPGTLLNMSRRSALHLPRILWRERKRGPVFFRAHTGKGYTKGELTLPGFETISDNRLPAQLGYLKGADRIISAKLHPGVIALSFGTHFEAVYPRPKTTEFLREASEIQFDPNALFRNYMTHLRNIIA